MSGIRVRRAKLLELRTVAKWSRAAAAEDYSFYSEAVQRTIANRNAFKPLFSVVLGRSRVVLVAEDESGKLIGCMVMNPTIDQVGVVQWLYVPPFARKQGVARVLLERFEDMAQAAGAHKAMLWTEVAEAYYHRLGWKTEAKLANHWWGQDFAILVKSLDKPKNPR